MCFRPSFYTLYIEEPDSSGHSYGPVSGGVSTFPLAYQKINVFIIYLFISYDLYSANILQHCIHIVAIHILPGQQWGSQSSSLIANTLQYISQELN